MRARFYLGLLGMRVRTSLTTGMQYRWDFLLDVVMSVFWAGVAILPLWLVGVCGAFGVGRLDTLASLFMSVFAFARWPISIFKGVLRLFFTFITPLAIMTTSPAEALLGRLEPSVGLAAFGGAFAFAVI